MGQIDIGGGEGTCKRCGELVIWVTMVRKTGKRGKRNPLDPVPSSRGKITRWRDLGSGQWLGRYAGIGARGPLYQSHLETCKRTREL